MLRFTPKNPNIEAITLSLPPEIHPLKNPSLKFTIRDSNSEQFGEAILRLQKNKRSDDTKTRNVTTVTLKFCLWDERCV